eukprot:531915-Amorphochlora_amoeboformis.AAC.1
MGMDIWALTTANCDKVWPKLAPMGGYPATIKISLKKIHSGNPRKKNASLDEVNLHGYNKGKSMVIIHMFDQVKEACKNLADKCQIKMQAEVDKFYSGKVH